MYGDPGQVHALARQVRSLAAQTRADATAVGDAKSVQWASVLADDFRRDLHGASGTVRACAGELDDLAVALDEHARQVQHRLDQIHLAERFLGGLLDGARHELTVATTLARDATTGAARAAAEAAARTARSTLGTLGRAPATGTSELVAFVRSHGFPGGW